MNVLKKKGIIILGTFLFIVLLCFMVLILNNNKNEILINKNTFNTIDKNMFAIMIEKEDGNGYIKSEIFPTDYVLNTGLSNCADKEGKVIDNALEYDIENNNLKLKTKKSIHCYLYFDKDDGSLIQAINIIDNYYTSARISILSSKSGTYCVNTNSSVGTTNTCVLSGNITSNISIETNNLDESGIYYVHLLDSKGNESVSEALDIKVLYQKVEYIETTGTQYINSGVKATNSSIDFTLQFTDNSSSQGIIGARASSSTFPDRFNLFFIDSKVRLDWRGLTDPEETSTISLNKDINIKLNQDRSVDVNGTYYDSNASSMKLDMNLYIGNFNNNGTTYSIGSYAKWKIVKMYTSGVLVREFVPVYRLSDNEIGLFDDVKKMFYTNEGTGSFKKGSDIVVNTPSNNNVLINDGARTTENTNVTLTLSSNGATEMCISNTNSCDSWEVYSASKDWTLTSGNGYKTVYVWFRNAEGNKTSVISDTIILDIPTYVCTTNTTLGSCLISAKTSGFNSSMQGGLYRYQGTTNVNNYICVGTSDKTTCVNDTDKYMYRIIGVNSSNQVKLIKQEALNFFMQWHDEMNDTNTLWPNSTPYQKINGSSFLTYTFYLSSEWQNKIASYIWKYGETTNINYTAANMYSVENAFTNTVNAKVGLLYLHDYYYAYQSGGLNCSSSYITCKESWIHMSNCDSTTSSTWEWTMTKYGLYDNSSYNVWTIYTNGSLYSGYPTGAPLARPVFFLNSTVNYISGSGTISDPFTIT